MHRTLERQVKKYLGSKVSGVELRSLLESVSRTYSDFDEDRAILDRSLELSSKEFQENNNSLERTRKKVEQQAKSLAIQVAKRTKELGERVGELENARMAMTNLLEDFEVAKNRERDLVTDLQKFKLAVDNASDRIAITDIDGVVLYANGATEKNTGYKPEETIGKKEGVLWKKPMPLEYYQNLWNTIKVQKKVFIGEIENKRRSGDMYTALISISPILNTKGDVEFFVGIERDITKEKEIDRAKTEFVSVASHALRTPLTAIDGLVSMIRDGEYGPVNKELKQPLQDISASSERLIHLVNDLLSLSRIQAGRMTYSVSDFSIADVVMQTTHLLQPLAEEKGLKLVVMKSRPVFVSGDSDKVKEVLNNLIGNAIKFTDRGSVSVASRVVDNKVEVQIIDTGIGISKQDQQKLFGKFQQLDSSRGRTVGTGLGLYISKEIIQKMGGELWIERSEIGKGSTFVFSLPIAKSQRATKPENKKRNSQTNTSLLHFAN